MVKFWYEILKKSRSRCIERIKLSEKHGIGQMAMSEKARLKKIDKNLEKYKT